MQQQKLNSNISSKAVHYTHTHTLPPSLFPSPPFWLLHFDSVLVVWNLTVESILSETKWYFTPAAVSCCNFLFKHLYAPAMPFKTSELSYCVMTEWRGHYSREGIQNESYCIELYCTVLYFFSTTCSSLIRSQRWLLGVISVQRQQEITAV